MTRVKHHKPGRGAATLAAAAALVAAAATTAVLAQDAEDAAPPVGAIPASPDVLPVEPAPLSEPEPEPEPEPEDDAAEAEDEAAEDDGVLLTGKRPLPVQPNPERRITLVLSETLSADSDIGLDGDGAAFGSVTRAGLQYISIGPISSFRASTELGLNFFTGSGASDANLNVPTPTVSLGWQRAISPTTQMSLGFNGSLKPETFTGDPTFSLSDADGDGFFEVETRTGDEKDALRLSLSASAGLTHTINSLNSVSMSFSASKVDYFDADTDRLTPYTRYGLNGGWSAQLSPTVSGGLSGGVSTYFSDAADERETYTFNVSGNGGWIVNRRMSVNASLGPNLSFTSRTDPSTGLSDDYSSLSARGQLGIKYTLSDTTWSAGLSQGVQPTTEGSIANVSSLTFQMQHQINRDSSVTLGSAISYQLPLSEQDEDQIDEQLNLTLRAAYTHSLTRDVNASLGYAFRWRDDEDDSFVSHKVFLTLTKSFTFLP